MREKEKKLWMLAITKDIQVLMSVYHKEKPEYLKQAIASIQAQTLPTDDFVLVCDGPLNDALDAVIAKKQQEMGKTLNVVRLAKNGGLGNALNEGIKHCKNELVARMDSDDIAYQDRCEKQIAVFYKHSEVSICSGIVEEFTSTPDVVDAKRVPPEAHEEIVEFAKKRNPFNHPCVMYKKSVVEAVGLLSGLLPAGGLLPLAPNADGWLSGIQHTGAAAPYESWLGYVFKKGRLEVRQNTGKALQVHEGTRLHWRRTVHKELRDS